MAKSNSSSSSSSETAIERSAEIKREAVNEVTTTTSLNCSECQIPCGAATCNKSNKPNAKALRVFVILLGTFCTVYVCMLSSERYLNSWVQTVIERTDVHVSEIPFPAITICPVSINMWRAQAAMDRFLLSNGTADAETERMFVRFVQSLEEIMWPHVEELQKLRGIDWGEFLANYTIMRKFHAIDLNELLLFMSYECDEIFLECSWRRVKTSCCRLFNKIETYKGICFSFNSMLGETHDSTWPWRVSDAGHSSGLRVLIRRALNGQHIERIAAMIHDPYESLTTDINYLDGDRMIITVSPLRFTADPDIHAVKPEFRHCYFPGEKKVMGATKSQCIANCRLWYIERNCNCTYYLQHLPRQHAKFHVCTAAEMKCIYDHRAALSTTGNIIAESHNNIDYNILNCECYPNCNHVQYSASFYTDNTSDDKDITELFVHYQQDTFFSYRSVLRFTLLDLIVSYGGIAGLFLGLSLVGAIEAIYQLIVTCKSRRGKRENENVLTAKVNAVAATQRIPKTAV